MARIFALLISLAAIAALGSADPSPACGAWSSGCVEDQMSMVYVNRTLNMQTYSYPNGTYPAVDYEGTFGSYTSQNLVFSESTCGKASLIATVWMFGSWVDNGPAQFSLYRKIELAYTSMKVKPMTGDAVLALQTLCPCGNPNAWQNNTMRTITSCTDACEIPWVNFSNVGHNHYGVVRAVNNTMNMSQFVASALYNDNTTLFTMNRDDVCAAPTTFTELCGQYTQDCRPSATGVHNLKVTFSLLGSAAGTFSQGYDYYALSDVNCSQPFIASYHISGNYALHGPSDCDGTCQNAVSIEVFAQSSSFMPVTNETVDELNANCACGGVWKLGIARTITVCPIGTCSNLQTLEFTHGIPAGTTKPAYANLLPFNNFFMSLSEFSQTAASVPAFDASDHAFLGDYTDDCSDGKMDSALTCGQYVSQCAGSPSRMANYVENTTFFGPGNTGAYRRVYQQFNISDRFCVETPIVEYILEGTFAIDGDSNCPDCTAMGTYSKIEITITRTQLTAFTQDALDSLKSSCPCGRTAWKLNTSTTITTCAPDECQLETFPGIQGLTIGTVQPSYGTITRFGKFITMTAFNNDPAIGYHTAFTTASHILYFNAQYDGCDVPPQSAAVCGSYRDGCRGGTPQSDGDNIVRTLSLLGEQFGEFTVSQQLYLSFDTDCTNATLNGQFTIVGTYALHGPSTCGGSCADLGAQQIEMSTAYAIGSFYNGQYIDFLNLVCNCSGEWQIGIPRTLVECPPGTCLIDIRGLPLGSGAPVYGSLLRFGDFAQLTTLNPSLVAGYTKSFDSLDQPMYFDQATTAGACPSSPISNLCGVFRSACSAFTNNTTFYNTLESMTFSGSTAGSFTRTFKSYTAAQGSSCTGIVLQNWEIVGTYEITGTSNCGGTCVDANTTMLVVSQATITLTSQADVEIFNSKCACGGQWAVGQQRVISNNCDHCTLYTQQGAHGLEVGLGLPSFGSVTLASGRLATTCFSANPVVGYATPFEPQTDRVYTLDGTASANLNCVASSPSSSSNGLTAGDGLLIAFFCLLAVYLIGGVVLNHRNGATGQDLVPHLSFWKSIPGLMGDGFRFAFVDCFGARGTSVAPAAGYETLPSRGYGTTA